MSVPELKLAAIRLPHTQCLVDTDSGETLYTFTTENGLRAYRQNVVDNDVIEHWPRLQYHKYKLIVCD